MLQSDEIKALRRRMGLDQTAFGELFKVKSGAVGHWERGRSSPPESTMLKLDNLYVKHFDKGRVNDGNDMPYLRSPGVHVDSADPNINPDLKRRAEEARQVARGYYEKLTAADQAKLDLQISAIIFSKWTESDNSKEGEGSDD